MAHVFLRVCGYVVYLTFVSPSVFRPFLMKEGKRKKKTVLYYIFHAVLLKLECLEIARISSRFTVRDAECTNTIIL